ncbi:gag-protease polyprotein, partial [Trifolium pratense]
MDKEGKPTLELKPEEEWSKEEDELALANSKALYALYNGVDKHIFRLIKKCASAKEAWIILQTVHEGTSKVKMLRLQLLTTKFENLRLNDDETIQEFHMTLLDYDNQF